MDCYCHEIVKGERFLVSSWHDELSLRLALFGSKLLDDGLSGIDEVRIARRSEGAEPSLPLDLDTKEKR